MLTPERLQKLLAEYEALRALERKGTLTDTQRQRLELMRDVVLEAGVSMDAERSSTHSGRASPRTNLKLEVSFPDAKEAAKAFTRDVSTRGLSIQTTTALAIGTTLEVQVVVPGLDVPMRTIGEVVWAKEGAAGLAFRKLPAEHEQLLKRLVSESQSFLDRVKSSLASRKEPVVSSSRLVEPPPPAPPPAPRPAPPAPTAVVTNAAVGILVRLSDTELEAAVIDLFSLHGLVAGSELTREAVKVVVVDLSSASLAAQQHPTLPFVFVNMSGPDALVGRLAGIRNALFVPRPATARDLLDVVRIALGP